MKVISSRELIYFFDKINEPICQVDDGESFWVEAPDCYNGQIKSEKDLRTDIDVETIDGALGPIKVNNAKKGDILVIEVKDIKLNDQGVMLTNHGLGILGDFTKDVRTKVIKVDHEFAYFDENIKIPLSPMVGVLGLAPENGRVHCASAGDFGGNMDTKELKKGSKLYLPVFVDGANFAISDLHAAMGDGEISGTGIEISGKVLLKTSLIKNKSIKRPIIETEDSYYFLASHKSFDEAARICSKDLSLVLQEKLDLDFEDAYMLMSASCDLGIGQVVNDVYTLKIRLKKDLIKKSLL